MTAGHRDTNPVVGVELPRARASTEEDWTFLRSNEVETLLAHDAFSRTRAGWRSQRIFTIAIFSGMRQGELWGLRWNDVHLRREDPHVVVRYGNAQGSPTKNGRIRTVPLLPPARQAFQELRSRGDVTPAGARHVFLGRGELPHAKGYDAGWAGSWHRPRPAKLRVFRKGWRERCQVRGEVTFHDLRHTCASHLVMGTWGRAWRLEEVKTVLGHQEVSVTERYAHLAPEGLRRSAAEAERLWSRPSAQCDTGCDTL